MKIKLSLTVCMFIMLIAFSAAADTEMVQVNKTEAAEMMGQKMPAKSDTVSIWFGDQMIALKSEQMHAVVRNDKGMFFIMMPQHQQYVEFPLSMFDASNLPDSTVLPAVSAVVTVTDSTKTLGPWNCQLYIAELTMKMGMTSRQEMWVTKDIDLDFAGLATASMGMMAAFPGYNEVIAEWKKIDGIPVEIDNKLTVMGATMSTFIEVISVTTKDAPAGIYDIPEGYSKVDASQLSPH